jgi:hypothetical protein
MNFLDLNALKAMKPTSLNLTGSKFIQVAKVYP